MFFAEVGVAAGKSSFAEWGFPLLLIVAGLGLLLWHIIAWQRAKKKFSADGEEWRFRQRQFRRRMQVTSILIGLGILLFFGTCFFANTSRPILAIVYWLVVGIVTLWMVLLACADMWAGVSHFRRLKDQSDLEQLRLSVLAERLRRARDDGQHEARQKSREK